MALAAGEAPLVSIVIPTRNRAGLLPRALGSALHQTYAPIEVIVVDDGSTDETAATVHAWQARHRNLRYLRHDVPAGASAARNRGLHEAHGLLVTMLDDDDEFAPTRVATLAALLRREPALSFVSSDYRVVRAGGERRSRKAGVITLERILWTNVASQSVLTTRERLLAIGGFDEAFVAAQDHDAFTRLIAAYGPAHRIGDALYTYHQAHLAPRISTDAEAARRGRYQYYRAHKHRMTRDQRAWHLYRLLGLRGRQRTVSHLLHMVPARFYASELHEYLHAHRGAGPVADPAHAPRAHARLAVSVVVCTRDRERFLPGVLESLARQTAAHATYEVVIVDNGSTDGTAALCGRFIDAHPDRQVRYVADPRTGLSLARNRGMLEARGRVITYIDDDAVAAPDLVEAVATFFASQAGAAAAGGRVRAVFDDEPPGWLNRFSASLFFSHCDRGEHPFRFTRWNGYPIGCNMSFRADVLREAQGFDSELGRHGRDGIGGEEKALFARLIAGGLACWYDPRQVVHHRIEAERTAHAYVRQLALGLGRTHRLMYCRGDLRRSCAWHLAVTIAKLGVALALALAYLVMGRPRVSRHLVAYRCLVLQGYLRADRSASTP